MKPFFGKEIIERPRRGSRNRNIKIRDFGKFVKDEDGNPEYEGFTKIPAGRGAAKRLYSDAKDFTDVLGPLHGYLRSSCGRLWNDVYSEIAKVLGNAGYALGHIITDHLEVETDTYRDAKGRVWAQNKHGVEEIGWNYYRSRFYVEPETGRLRESPRVERYPKAPVPPPDRIPIANGTEYRKLHGIWYHREFTEVEVTTPVKLRYGTRYETTVVVVSEKKRQLGKKQLKELGLKNETVAR